MQLSDAQNKAMAKALTQEGATAMQALCCYIAVNSEGVGGFCASIGKSRNYINHVVCGRQQLPEAVKQKVVHLTGINFWALVQNHQQHKKAKP